MAAGALAALLALAPVAGAEARPVSRIIDLVAGNEQFFRASVASVAVDSPEVCAAELLPSQELLLTPKKAGRVLLFLLDDDGLEVVRIRVRESGGAVPEVRATDEQLRAAAKACPGMKVEGSKDARELSATVPTAACRDALAAVFATDDFVARNIELMYTPDALKAQLDALRAAIVSRGLGDKFSIAYSGLNVLIKGRGSPADKTELMKILFDGSVGRVLLDDHSETVAPADAGSKEPAGSPESPGTSN